MTGHEFIKRLRVLAAMRRERLVLDAKRGKGSHQTVYFGSSYTVLRDPKDELKTGTLHAMCRQLGIKASDL